MSTPVNPDSKSSGSQNVFSSSPVTQPSSSASSSDQHATSVAQQVLRFPALSPPSFPTPTFPVISPSAASGVVIPVKSTVKPSILRRAWLATLPDSELQKIAKEKWGSLISAQALSIKPTYTSMVLFYPTAMCPVNSFKNRYKDILARESTRVRLQNQADEQEASQTLQQRIVTKFSTTDYINANYIFGVDGYIATQGPKKETLLHFFQMSVEQLNAFDNIVCLTNPQEDGTEKTYPYWLKDDGTEPKVGETIHRLTEGHLTVEVTLAKAPKLEYGTPEGQHVIRRNFTITLANALADTATTKEIGHWHYVNWPDMGGADPHVLKQLVEKLDKHVVIHCSAGVGRTGTLIAIHCFLQEDLMNRDEPLLISDKVIQTIQKMRQYREEMVQTEAQILTILRTLQLFARESSGNGELDQKLAEVDAKLANLSARLVSDMTRINSATCLMANVFTKLNFSRVREISKRLVPADMEVPTLWPVA